MKRKEVITTVKKMVVCLAIPLTMSLTCGSTTALAQTTHKSEAVNLAQTTKKNSKKKKLNKKSKSALAKKKLKKKSKRISKIRIKGKAADNHNKLKLDSNNINLKLKNVGNRYGVTLHNVKWVFTPVNTEQDSNTAPEIPKTPSNSDTTKNDPSTSTEVPDNSNTTTTPDTTIVEGSTAITLAQSVVTTAPSPITNRQRSAKVTIIKPGTYRVQATLLGKTYTLNKTVTVPEIDYSTRW